LPFSTIFLLDFATVVTVWYFLFFILFFNTLQGITFAVYLHQSRALTEKKEKVAKPIVD